MKEGRIKILKDSFIGKAFYKAGEVTNSWYYIMLDQLPDNKKYLAILDFGGPPKIGNLKDATIIWLEIGVDVEIVDDDVESPKPPSSANSVCPKCGERLVWYAFDGEFFAFGCYSRFHEGNFIQSERCKARVLQPPYFDEKTIKKQMGWLDEKDKQLRLECLREAVKYMGNKQSGSVIAAAGHFYNFVTGKDETK